MDIDINEAYVGDENEVGPYIERDNEFEWYIRDDNEIVDENEDEVTEIQFENNDELQDIYNLTEEAIMNRTFQSEEEAYKFYNLYGRIHGFSIRRCTTKLHEDYGVVVRIFRCSRAGLRSAKYIDMPNRKRQHRPLTRCQCKALLRIKYDFEAQCFVVTTFIKEHSHDLVAPHEVTLLRSHRRVDEGHKNQAHLMQRTGIGVTKIMDVMELEAGGPQNVGFTRKDLYNAIGRLNLAEIEKGDAKVSLAYLQSLANSDAGYFFKYEVDDENRLDKLFWADGRSREEFKLFGDVLVFDATYSTNRYKYPLILFAGATNHRTTCLFGAAIVRNETTDSYVWVLSTFVEAMDNRRPSSVVTDGDRSMHAAVELVFPDAVHRLCKWHLQKNAGTNVHIKNFNGVFNRYMSMDCPVYEFEQKWSRMVDHFKITEHRWVQDVYQKKHMWAEAYLRGHFFGGIKSTQRCEGMNHYMHHYVKSGMKLINFLRGYHSGVLHLRQLTLHEEVKTKHTSPVFITELRDLEIHASTLFTRTIFYQIQDEIKYAVALWTIQIIEQGSGAYTYLLGDKHDDNRIWQVNSVRPGMVIRCECLMLESEGIPCSHVIHVLKCERANGFPQTCIKDRWTARISSDIASMNLACDVSTSEVRIARHGELTSLAAKLTYYGAQTESGYQHVKDRLLSLTDVAKQLAEMELSITGHEDDDNVEGSNIALFNVADPPIARPKGRAKDTTGPRRPPRCRECG